MAHGRLRTLDNNRSRLVCRTDYPDRKRSRIQQIVYVNTPSAMNKPKYDKLGDAVVKCRTRDRKVAGSTPGRGASKSTRSFHPSGVGKSSTGLHGWARSLVSYRTKLVTETGSIVYERLAPYLVLLL